MSKTFCIEFSGEVETAQVDFFEVRSAAGSRCRLLALYLSQTSEVGDAEEEQLLVQVVRSGSGARAGSGGSTAPTPRRLSGEDATFGGTVGTVTNTTKISGGSPETLHSEAWNVRTPFFYGPIFSERPEWSAQEYLTVELSTTPADAVTFFGTLVWEELG